MRLLEIVPGPASDPALVERVSSFCDHVLGKSIVRCKDTPGFIANRIGTYWLQRGVNAALDGGLSVEEADAVMGRPFGIPKTGVFGLLDLVGLDLMPHIDASMTALLTAEDAYVRGLRDNPLLTKMIGDGYTGRKGKGGFYRINREAGKIKESIGLVTGVYEPSRETKLPDAASKDMRALVAGDDRYGRYAWAVMSDVLSYAASLVPAISDDIVGVDAAMRLGFNWKQGPFEILDRLGPAAVAARLAREGRPVPDAAARGRRPQLLPRRGRRAASLRHGRRLSHAGAARGCAAPRGRQATRREPLLKNGSAALWDVGEGVACFEITSKMNSFDEAVLKLLEKSIALVGRAVQGAGPLQRRHELLGRRQSRAGALRLQHRRLGRGREARVRGPTQLQGAEIREVPGRRRRRRAWRSVAAARSCSIATPSRPMPRPIRASSNAAWASYPAGAAAARC